MKLGLILKAIKKKHGLKKEKNFSIRNKSNLATIHSLAQ